MNTVRRNELPKKQQEPEISQEQIRQTILLLNTHSISNKDELFNTNPIKFRIQLDPRDIKYIKEIKLIPFYIPKIDGIDESDKIYVTIDELCESNFHFVCTIKIYKDTLLLTPQNNFSFYNKTTRLRSNIISVSFKLYDCTILPLDYSFSVGVSNSMFLTQELINYIEKKKIHTELIITYVPN